MANYSPGAQLVLSVLKDRTVAYYPKLATVLGGVKETVLACHFLYWDGKGKRPDGFFWKTQKEITKETGLSRWEQEGARKSLKKLGVLEEKRIGVPATLHYKLDLNRLVELIEQAYSPTPQIVEKQQSRSRETHDLDREDPTNQIGETPQSIPETTPETTHEKTTGNFPGSHEPDPPTLQDVFPRDPDLRPLEPSDPLEVAAREQWGNRGPRWSVPEGMVDVDQWHLVVDEFTALAEQDPPPKIRNQWARVFEKLGNTWGVGPEILVTVIEEIPSSGALGWMYDKKGLTTPHAIKDRLGTMIGQYLNGGIQVDPKLEDRVPPKARKNKYQAMIDQGLAVG